MSYICHLHTCFCVQRKRGNLIAGGVWLILLSLFRATWWRNTLKLTVVPKCSLQTEHCRSCRKEDWIRYTCVIHYELLQLLTSLMKISLIKISWCCYFHFISADYILGGNADLGSILSIMSPTVAVVWTQDGRENAGRSCSNQNRLKFAFWGRRRGRSRVVETCLKNYHQNSIFVNEMHRVITSCLDYLCIEEMERALFVWAFLGQATCRTGSALNVVT